MYINVHLLKCSSYNLNVFCHLRMHFIQNENIKKLCLKVGMRLPSTIYVSLYCKLYSTNRNLSWKKKKKIQSLEFKLDIWNQSSSASVKYAGNQSSLGNTPRQSWIGGE